MTVLSAFNPHEFPEQTVRTVATGRESNLKEVLDTIRSNLAGATIQHLIIAAPRGYGKSFMMRHIQIEVTRLGQEEALPLAVVLMPEEMPHVKEPETLIRELTRGLIGKAGSDAELSWHEDDGAVWESAVEALNAAILEKVGPRGVLVALVENFDVLLRRAFPKEIQALRLRELLGAQGGRLMLIAASASGAFDRDYDKALFQAFHEINLEPWSVDDCLAFFDRQRNDAGKSSLGEAARARARAVANFIGGTPRLATLLGDALLDEDVLKAAELLQHLVDELTPYYKERIEALPGRSQKLLDALVRGGEPATQSEIAQRVNANSQSAIAGPFNDLVRERIVVGERAKGSAEVLYRVSDRVFAHYYRRRIVDHGKAACPLGALVELLAEYFSPQEKKTKAAEFARSGRIEEARVMARLHDADRKSEKQTRRWMLNDLKQHYIPERLLPYASETMAVRLRLIADTIDAEGIDRAYTMIEASLAADGSASDHALLLLARSELDAYEGIDGGVAAMDQAIKAVELSNDPDLQLMVKTCRLWNLTIAGRYSEVLDCALDMAERSRALGFDQHQARALRHASFSLLALKRFDEAAKYGRQAVGLAEKAGDILGRITALRHTAYALELLKQHAEAAEISKEAADIAKQKGFTRELALNLIEGSYSLSHLGEKEKGLADSIEAARLMEATGDTSDYVRGLSRMSYFLVEVGRYDDALANARRAFAIAQNESFIRLEAFVLNDVVYCLSNVGNHEEAIVAARQAVELARQADMPLEEAEAFRFLAFNLGDVGNHVEAIQALASSAAILDMHFDEEMPELVRASAVTIAGEAAKTLAVGGIDTLHAVLRAASEYFDVEGTRRSVLQKWLEELARRATFSIEDAALLGSWAGAIALHFPGRFEPEVSALRDAERYHASGRDPATLERLDPDVARSLRIRFPARETPPKSKGPARGKPAKNANGKVAKDTKQ